MVAEMDRLLEDYNYADTARILNEKGFKTGDGLPLTSIAIGYVRKAYGLKSRFDRLRERGIAYRLRDGPSLRSLDKHDWPLAAKKLSPRACS